MSPASGKAAATGGRRIMAVFLLRGGLVGSLFGSVLASGLLVVFSHIFKSPDGSPLFSAQLDPMLVLLAAAVIRARSAARMDPLQAIRA